MNVTVFGATGKIGRLVVERLLADGHTVTAYVRDPAKLHVAHPRLSMLAGELSHATTVAAAVAGADAVVSALGPSLERGATGTPVADGTRTIVAAMTTARVRRYVGLATPSVADGGDRATVRARVLRRVAATLFPNALRELDAMTAAVTGSDLEWTLARITSPTDRPPKGTIRVGFLGRDEVGWAMTRADIAAFVAGQVSSGDYVRRLPAISN